MWSRSVVSVVVFSAPWFFVGLPLVPVENCCFFFFLTEKDSRRL